jgi:hypothetical protein
MFDENTSARIAAIAARGLHDPGSLSLDEIRAVCGTALTQVSDKPQGNAMGAHHYYNSLAGPRSRQ